MNVRKVILFLAISISYIFADTTNVEIFNNNYIHFGGDLQNDSDIYTELDNGRILAKNIDLPEFSSSVKIIAHLDVDSNGDPWDRAGTIFLDVPEQNNIEILKFITGFGGHSVLEQDVTFLAPMLKGNVTIKAFVDTWVQNGWVFDFSLEFIDQDTLNQSTWNYATLFNSGLTKDQIDVSYPNSQINIPPSQERIMLTYYVSGHCTDGNGADEFISKDNVIAIDGTEIHRYKPWRDDCINFRDRNPSSGRWGDVWSSDLDRSGWCPGDIVYPVILDVTDQLDDGLHDITYWIENIRPKDVNGNYGYWRVSSFLTGWGDISNWIPNKILLTGPNENTFPPNAIIDLRVDLVDQFGYTVFKTDQTVEFAADSANAVFSIDKENWSNPLQVNIKLGTANVWFKSPVEGEITVSVKDVDAEPNMEEADNFTINIKKAATTSGNYALQFDGNDDYVNCGNDSSLQITGNKITLEAWIYANQWASEVWQGCIINKEQNGGSNDNGYMLRCGKNGTLNFNLGSGSWNEINSAAGEMTSNKWYHVAGTYDGNVMRSFVNGEEVASASKKFSIKNALDIDLLIGESQNNSGRVFNGMIDEIRIWNVARSQQQLKSTMKDSLDSKYYSTLDSGLVAYLRFNENEGQFTNDFTSNANNGRLGSTADSDANDPLWVESGSLVNVNKNQNNIPSNYRITQNYPNPFNNETTVTISLPQVAKVHAVVFNSNGELVKHLVNGQLPKGEHLIKWDSKNQNGNYTSSGIYFLNVRFTESSGKSFNQALKMVYLK
ncbi:MAG: T9SS type A sorting domain-containing protein [Ignavibacteriales bacterium]|nr:T9SS type A sorting domain-containing protein [Ignavibacteriales bacterium]MCB9259798.1 T9SS type A sorting domain-containing protein [Ignavibacteriales bacterium]